MYFSSTRHESKNKKWPLLGYTNRVKKKKKYADINPVKNVKLLQIVDIFLLTKQFLYKNLTNQLKSVQNFEKLQCNENSTSQVHIIYH